MKRMNFITIMLLISSFGSCQSELTEFKQGDLIVSVEQGEEWLHDFPLFMGITKKNPPQIAIWLEDTTGNYLATVYASHKIALTLLPSDTRFNPCVVLNPPIQTISFRNLKND